MRLRWVIPGWFKLALPSKCFWAVLSFLPFRHSPYPLSRSIPDSLVCIATTLFVDNVLSVKPHSSAWLAGSPRCFGIIISGAWGVVDPFCGGSSGFFSGCLPCVRRLDAFSHFLVLFPGESEFFCFVITYVCLEFLFYFCPHNWGLISVLRDPHNYSLQNLAF